MNADFLSSRTGFLISCAASALIAVVVFYAVPALRYAPIVEPTIEDVDPAEFQRAYAENPEVYVFIDVRPREVYAKLHAKGSALMPLHTLYQERFALPRNEPGKTIVLICSGGSASGVGYSYLEHYGFRNILRIEGGIEQWQAKGLPVEGTDVLQ